MNTPANVAQGRAAWAGSTGKIDADIAEGFNQGAWTPGVSV
jgi:hypothetical protein